MTSLISVSLYSIFDQNTIKMKKKSFARHFEATLSSTAEIAIENLLAYRNTNTYPVSFKCLLKQHGTTLISSWF